MNSIQKADTAQLIYTGEGALRLEEEIILPDYCPDVARLLRVEMTPVIDKSRAYIQDGGVTVSITGGAEFTVIYSSPDGECESYSFTLPVDTSFKKELSRKSGIVPDSVALSVSPFTTAASAKPLTSRKLLARGEARLICDVFSNVEYSAYDGATDTGRVECKRGERYAAYLTGCTTSKLSIVQDIKIPPTLPSGAKVLSCTANLSVDSATPARDSATVFMTATFNVLYLSEETGERAAELVSFCQPVEVRERLECDDCAEDSVCRIRACLGGAKCTLECDSFGEMRIFHLELPYTLTCLVLENLPITLVSDAYGIGCESECRASEEEFTRYIGSLSEGCQFKKRISLVSDTDAVHGVEGRARVNSVSFTDSGAVAHLEVLVGAVPEKDGVLSADIRESLEVELPLNVPDSIRAEVKSDETVCDATATLSFVDAQVIGEEIEVSGEITLQAMLWEKSRVKFVEDVVFSEGKERKRNTLFYYPTPDDTLWSVGKRYGVGMNELKEMNKIEGESLPCVCKIFDGN